MNVRRGHAQKNEDTGGVVRNGGDPGYIGMEALRTMVPSYTIADHAGEAPITDALVLHDHFYKLVGLVVHRSTWAYTLSFDPSVGEGAGCKMQDGG